MNSSYVICDCRKYKCWVEEDTISLPCPHCGAKYEYKVSKKSGVMEVFKIKKKNMITNMIAKLKELFLNVTK